jgi:RHS repeat-associated protein
MFSQLDIGRRIENMVYSKEGNLVMGYGYEWNRVGMRMIEERIHRGKLDRFSYDWKMRLINAKIGAEKNNPDLFEKQISYVLDLVDNIRRITETKDSTTTTIETTINNRNQYTKFGNLNLSYDFNGNLKQKGNKNFTYDYKNQLVKYTDPNKTVEFRYDPFGRRIQKKVELNNSQSSQITNYYYEGYRVIEERDNSERVAKQYVYGSGIDELLRMDIYQNQTPTPYYLHHNLIGSITGITDENGNLIELIEYDPYGKPYFLKPTGNPENPYSIQNESTIGNSYLFQGREYDSETGLYYFRARYYDPELGRFLQPDPKGYIDSMNLYQAFNLNPINFLDPFGNIIIVSQELKELLDRETGESIYETAINILKQTPKGKELYDILEGSKIEFYIEVLRIPERLRNTAGKISLGEFKAEERGGVWIGVIKINVEDLQKMMRGLVREGKEVDREYVTFAKERGYTDYQKLLETFYRFKGLQSLSQVVAEVMGHEFAHAVEAEKDFEKAIERQKIRKKFQEEYKKRGYKKEFLETELKDLWEKFLETEKWLYQEETLIAYPAEKNIYEWIMVLNESKNTKIKQKKK